MDPEQEKSDNSDKISRLYWNANFHAIRALNEINDQSLRDFNLFDTRDAKYHLDVAVRYLQQIDEMTAS